MKITYIHQHFKFPHEPGGQRPWEFTRRLAQRGQEVTVLCGGDEDVTEEIEGVRVRRIATPYDNSMSTSARIRSFLMFMARATGAAMTTKADLVFASSTPLTTAIPGMAASLTRRAPLVFEVRDLWPSVPAELGIITNPWILRAARLLEKVTYASASQIIALSPGMAEGVRSVDATVPLTVVPNASDVELFGPARESRDDMRRELGWGEDDVVLMYAGSFGHSYDLPWIVDLAAELRNRDGRFRVIAFGAGAATTTLQAKARAAGLDVEALLPGPIPKATVTRLLPAADFALSTLIDAKPLEVNSLNKVFDALAAATPVLFNHGGWLPGELADADAGVRLNRDPAQAAEELIELLTSTPDVRKRMSANAFALAQSTFDRELLFSTFAEVLETAADAGSRGLRMLSAAGRRLSRRR